MISHTPQPLSVCAVHLHPDDQVAVAKVELAPGTVLTVGPAGRPAGAITVRTPVPAGHKLALRDIAAGEPLRRYGHIIGFAGRAIAAGEHVHSHNVTVGTFARDYAFGADAHPPAYVPEGERRTFLGYPRRDGRVGTRNYVAIIATANCAAHAAGAIARHFTPERLAAYPHVDGVIALAHPYGCCDRDYTLLQRVLAGMACHPNVGACLIVGLGCEGNQPADLVERHGLCARCVDPAMARLPGLVIQSLGGIGPTVEAGIAGVGDLLPLAERAWREPQPIAALTLALQCGASDSWSGVTANPVLGLAVDELVRQGGTAVLAETPEIYGAEHLLTRRAANAAVGERLVARVRWWESYLARMGGEFENNAGPGNRAGGLSTIYEKALGGVAKGGCTPLNAVYEYAEPVAARGLVFMDSPGYDPIAVTGQVAGGCNLVVFTTGRGSCFGFKPAPTIKVCSNAATYAHMEGDMDLNAGRVLQGAALDEVARELFDLIVAVASGRATKSEAQGVGEAEFNPWQLGALT